MKGKGLSKLRTYSNCESLQLNFLSNIYNQLDSGLQVLAYFSLYPWYSDTIYVFHNLQDPLRLRKTRVRSVKLKSTKFCIMNQYLYWKYPGGIFLNCLLENEIQQTIKSFIRDFVEDIIPGK